MATAPSSATAMQKLHVKVPDGVSPGQKFRAQVAKGKTVTVTCPPNAKSGTTVRIQVPAALLQAGKGVGGGAAGSMGLSPRNPVSGVSGSNLGNLI